VNPANAVRRAGALRRFVLWSVDPADVDRIARGEILRTGLPAVRIELMGSISVVRIEDCYSRRVNATIDKVSVPSISRDDLLANTRAARRPKDQNDL
jgi:hypothetical protein